MTCKTCTYWKILPSTSSDRGDNGMAAQGYKNCDADNTKWKAFRFLHGEAKACDKYQAKKM